jgi:spoIIIJ-associated protein
MEPVDFEGKTIDEAISKACSAFQVAREKLKIEIIAEANPGFLGFGSKKAVIRACLLELDREIDSIGNAGCDPVDLFSPLSSSAAPPIKKYAPAKKYRKKKTEASSPRHPAKRPSEEYFGELSANAVNSIRLLEGILSRMGFSAEVKAQESQDAIILKITGDKDGLIIGKKGQNLDAIQYIVNKAVRRSTTDSKKIVIDSEEYRKRREESLVTTAIRAAEKVKKTKKPATLGPMNPHDRRIIHLTIQNEKTLTTKSHGDGEFRKVVIIPAQFESHRQ